MRDWSMKFPNANWRSGFLWDVQTENKVGDGNVIMDPTFLIWNATRLYLVAVQAKINYVELFPFDSP